MSCQVDGFKISMKQRFLDFIYKHSAFSFRNITKRNDFSKKRNDIFE